MKFIIKLKIIHCLYYIKLNYTEYPIKKRSYERKKYKIICNKRTKKDLITGRNCDLTKSKFNILNSYKLSEINNTRVSIDKFDFINTLPIDQLKLNITNSNFGKENFKEVYSQEHTIK